MCSGVRRSIPTNARRYVRAFEFRPGNLKVVHANIKIDQTRTTRQWDEAESEPSYEGRRKP